MLNTTYTLKLIGKEDIFQFDNPLDMLPHLNLNHNIEYILLNDKAITCSDFNDNLYDYYSYVYCIEDLILAGKLALHKYIPNTQEYISEIEINCDINKFKKLISEQRLYLFNYDTQNKSKGTLDSNGGIVVSLKNKIKYIIIEDCKITPLYKSLLEHYKKINNG